MIHKAAYSVTINTSHIGNMYCRLVTNCLVSVIPLNLFSSYMHANILFTEILMKKWECAEEKVEIGRRKIQV